VLAFHGSLCAAVTPGIAIGNDNGAEHGIYFQRRADILEQFMNNAKLKKVLGERGPLLPLQLNRGTGRL
jgi:hypothetical protein